MPKHEVSINNVGVVWTGTNRASANRAYNRAVDRSSTGVVGVDGMQRVAWLCDGEIMAEFTPNPSYNPDRDGR